MSSKTKIFRVSSLLEFDLLKKSKFFRDNSLWFKYVENVDDKNLPLKLSVAVSKKYGNAVKRNLFKRRVKNAIYFLGQSQNIPKNMVLMIGIDRDCVEEISYKSIEESLAIFFDHINKLE